MTDPGRKYLSDIVKAIELIEEFVKTVNMYDDFTADIKTRSAVERQLGIIGEAVNNFMKSFPEEHIENAGRIIAFRNRLIHAYDTIDPSITWAIIRNHLDSLKSEARIRMQSTS